MIILLAISFIYLILCRDSATHFNGIDNANDKYFLIALLNRLYFILVTLTTIGYGDISPKSYRSKVLTCILIIFLFTSILKAFDSFFYAYKDKIKEII